jgi:ATP-dependent DNA helicase
MGFASAGHAKGGMEYPVFVTSYEIVMADVKALAKASWKYIVVDEGHRLKNFNCRLLRDLRLIPTENKLLLTGSGLILNLSG